MLLNAPIPLPEAHRAWEAGHFRYVARSMQPEVTAYHGETARESEVEGEAMRILLVDDEPTNREVAEVMLRSQGHEVSTAQHGAEALALCHEERHAFDLILMDLQMPVMDGFEAMRRLRAHPETRSVPILCVSAKVRGADREGGLIAGADNFLAKPFRRQELLDAIAATVGQRQAS